LNNRNLLESILNAKEVHAQWVESSRAVVLNVRPDGASYAPFITKQANLLGDIERAMLWPNSGGGSYFGVREVRLLPRAFFKDGLVAEFTDGEYLNKLEEDANDGDVSSQILLARKYDWGVSVDLNVATKFYEMAAIQGENKATKALIRLALIDKRNERDYMMVLRYGLRYLYNKYFLGKG
jgi:hypothetical protein